MENQSVFLTSIHYFGQWNLLVFPERSGSLETTFVPTLSQLHTGAGLAKLHGTPLTWEQITS